jgi:guanine nucleotide-binding protein alpha-1 subunit
MESGDDVNISEVVKKVGKILGESKEDVKVLWQSDIVQKMIKRRQLRLEECEELYAFIHTCQGLIPCSDLTGNSFLSAIDCVAAGGYIPSTSKGCNPPFSFIRSPIAIDDILHAHIQTMGVTEYRFELPSYSRTVTWHLYDVGGTRG